MSFSELSDASLDIAKGNLLDGKKWLFTLLFIAFYIVKDGLLYFLGLFPSEKASDNLEKGLAFTSIRSSYANAFGDGRRNAVYAHWNGDVFGFSTGSIDDNGERYQTCA